MNAATLLGAWEQARWCMPGWDHALSDPHVPPYYPIPRGKIRTRCNIWIFTVGSHVGSLLNLRSVCLDYYSSPLLNYDLANIVI